MTRNCSNVLDIFGREVPIYHEVDRQLGCPLGIGRLCPVCHATSASAACQQLERSSACQAKKVGVK